MSEYLLNNNKNDVIYVNLNKKEINWNYSSHFFQFIRNSIFFVLKYSFQQTKGFIQQNSNFTNYFPAKNWIVNSSPQATNHTSIRDNGFSYFTRWACWVYTIVAGIWLVILLEFENATMLVYEPKCKLMLCGILYLHLLIMQKWNKN